MRHKHALRCSDRKGAGEGWNPYGPNLHDDTDSHYGGGESSDSRCGYRSPGGKRGIGSKGRESASKRNRPEGLESP